MLTPYGSKPGGCLQLGPHVWPLARLGAGRACRYSKSISQLCQPCAGEIPSRAPPFCQRPLPARHQRGSGGGATTHRHALAACTAASRGPGLASASASLFQQLPGWGPGREQCRFGRALPGNTSWQRGNAIKRLLASGCSVPDAGGDHLCCLAHAAPSFGSGDAAEGLHAQAHRRHFFAVDADVEQGGAFAVEDMASEVDFVEVVGAFDHVAGHAERFGQFAVIGPAVASLIDSAPARLPAVSHHAGSIVEDDKNHGQALLGGNGNFLPAHQVAAVAGEAHHPGIPAGLGNADCGAYRPPSVANP